MKKATQFALALLCGGALTASAQVVANIITNGLNEPYAIAVDVANNYIITDSANNRVAIYTPDTGALTNLAGRIGVPGNKDGQGIFANFFSPQGIVAVGPAAFVVADSGNHTLRLVLTNGTVTTIAGKAGAAGLVNANGTNAQFNAPSGLAVDGNGIIYIADTLNNAIRRIDTAYNVTTIATNLSRPQAVAVGDNNILYVADTGNHSIVQINLTTGVVSLLAGSGSRFDSGELDSLIATEARFNNPRGLLWQANRSLLVSDSGNHTLRRVFTNATVSSWSVEQYGNVDGGGLVTPVGMVRDVNGNILVVDVGNSSVRSIQTQAPLPPVREPTIGSIHFTNSFDFIGLYMIPLTNATFINDTTIGVLSEAGTQTHYRYVASAFADGLADPISTDKVPPVFTPGPSVLPATLINPLEPDVTIKVQSTQADRRPSKVVVARVRFQVSNPVIVGNNPASFKIETATQNAELWYTTDGVTQPTNNALIARRYVLGTALNALNGTNDVTVLVRGFKTGYSPSPVIQQTFYYTNLQTTLIGFDQSYTAGVGANVIAPIGIKPAPNDSLRSLQFRAEVTPLNGAPPIDLPIDVLPFGTTDFVPFAAASPNAPTVLRYTATDTNGATVKGVAMAYLGTESNFRVGSATPSTVGMLGIPIPKTAKPGDRYQISIVYPSATSDGIQNPIPVSQLESQFIQVVAGTASYIVGDTAVAFGYNAGTFGNTNLDNSDVNNAFYASVGIRVPFPNTDVFDAMDAFPVDEVGFPGGDGQIRYLDWQYILRRALRLDTNNWVRYWGTNGVRQTSPLVLPEPPPLVLPKANSPAPLSVDLGVGWSRQVVLSGVSVENAQPGNWYDVPLYVKPKTGTSISGFQFRAKVEADDGAPALALPVAFVRADGIPAPVTLGGFPSNELVEAWNLGQFSPAITASNVLGYIRFQVPALASVGQTYTVRFSYADGAANLATQYQFDTIPAKVWVGTTATMKPRVSDEWKTYYFGDPKAVAAQENMDADGDGLSNYAEYVSGTNPNSSDWRFQLRNGGFVLRWFADSGKQYGAQVSTDLKNWSDAGAAVSGDDQLHEYVDANASAAARFYRVIQK